MHTFQIGDRVIVLRLPPDRFDRTGPGWNTTMTCLVGAVGTVDYVGNRFITVNHPNPCKDSPVPIVRYQYRPEWLVPFTGEEELEPDFDETRGDF